MTSPSQLRLLRCSFPFLFFSFPLRPPLLWREWGSWGGRAAGENKGGRAAGEMEREGEKEVPILDRFDATRASLMTYVACVAG